MYFRQPDDSPGYFPLLLEKGSLARDKSVGPLCSPFTSTLRSD